MREAKKIATETKTANVTRTETETRIATETETRIETETGIRTATGTGTEIEIGIEIKTESGIETVIEIETRSDREIVKRNREHRHRRLIIMEAEVEVLRWSKPNHSISRLQLKTNPMKPKKITVSTPFLA